MRIYIGPYIHRFTTSRLEDLWYKVRYGEQSRWSVEDSKTDHWDARFEKICEHIQTVLNATVNRIQDRRQRKIYVHIDRWDTWNADQTLSMIILPLLKKIKEDKHGSPYVDLEDVPESLRPTEPAGPANGYTDNTIHERWSWVIDEMIWTFEQLTDDNNGEDKFFDHSEANAAEKNGEEFTESWKKIKIDQEGLDAHNKRIQRGTLLFGKYFRGLWS